MRNVLFFIGLLCLPAMGWTQATLNSSTQIRAQQPKPSAVAKVDLAGVWQLGSSIVGSGLRANFQFFKTGKFIYNNADELNPLAGIIGTYYVDSNTLYLKVLQIKQVAGYKIVASEPSFQFGPFHMEGGKAEIVDQKDSEFSNHQFTVLKTTPKKVVLIDNDKYYKISNDPEMKQ
jgi:hypothetical protein